MTGNLNQVGAGTVCGTLLNIVFSLDPNDIFKTIILATIGAVVSYGVSRLLSRPCKKGKPHKHCAPSPTSIAILFGQITPPDGMPPLPGIDPLRMQVIISNSPLSCDAPYSGYDCREWRVSFGLPVELQVPGTLALDDPRLNSGISESWPNIGGVDENDCWAGGSSPVPGTVEIREISESALVVALSGVSSPNFDPNAVYTVSRCQ